MNASKDAGPHTLPEVWDQLYRQRVPEHIAQHSTVGGETQTFKELNAKAHCLAAYLISKGVTAGEPVLILSANIGSYLAMDLAVQYCGALNVTISQDFSSAQLVRILEQTEPRFLLVTSYALYDRHRGVLDQYVQDNGAEILCRTVSGIELTEQDRVTMMQNAVEVGKVFWREHTAAVREPREQMRPSDPCSILYDRVDGSEPRGAVLSHQNFLAAASDVQALLQPKAGETLLNLLSPAYGLGRLMGLYVPLLSGLNLVQVHNLAALLPAIQHYQPTYVTATPAMLRALRRTLQLRWLQRGWWARRNFRLALETAKLLLNAQGQGTPLNGVLKARQQYAQRSVWRKLQSEFLPGVKYFLCDGRGLTPGLAQFFELAGTPVITGFGLKETAGLLTAHHPAQRRFGTLGTVIPSAKARIRYGESFVAADTGLSSDTGHLEVAGEVVMLGYWAGRTTKGRPPASAPTWHDTGLRARLLDGQLIV